MALEDLTAAAFPTLDDETIAAIAECPKTRVERRRDGDVVVEEGSQDFGFYVVKRGRLDVLDVSGDEPRVIATHGPGQFTGDVAHVTRRASPVRIVARGDVELLAIGADGVQEILALHAELGDVILQAFIARRQLVRASGKFTGLRVIGSRYSQRAFSVREFLSRNRVPFTFLDLEADPEVVHVLERFGVGVEDTPFVAWGTRLLLRNPTDRELAEALGLRQTLDATVHDLVIVGSGPAGLAAAVYASSEGLDTLVLESVAPGGQAGASMRIENYLGFPLGITGSELAERAMLQASKFGARLPVPTPVRSMTFDPCCAVVHVEDGESVSAKCVLIATGAEYRKLGVKGCETFEGRGIYYAATPNESALVRGEDAVVVGGGNSAGQAVVYLAAAAKRVILVLRSADLGRNMSSYLAQRILETPNVEVLLGTEVAELRGNGHLAACVLRTRASGQTREVRCPALFSFIGANPRTSWLPDDVERDDKGFVVTGAAAGRSPRWPLARTPHLLETTRPGILAAGDVRSGSIKRVAAAVGDGSAAIAAVHEYLRET
jgi:thioredoxin reductase (NADPH)